MLSDIPSDSVKDFSDQVVDDPSSLLFGSLADFYRENGLYQEAINICLTGLESHPNNIEARLVLAQCYKGTGHTERARAELTKILSVQPQNSLAKKVLAELDKPGGSELQEIAISPAEESPIHPEKAEETPLAEEAIPTPTAVPAGPAMADPSDFHKGAQAMMALAAESAEKPKIEFVPPEPASQAGPMEVPAEPAPEKTAIPPKPPTEADPKTMSSYGRILNEIIQTPQVRASLLVDESGYPVASATAPQSAGLDEESSGALSSLVFTSASEAMQKVKLGELERVVIDTRNEKIFLSRVGSQVLMVTAESSAKTGLVAVNVKRAIDRIKNLSS